MAEALLMASLKKTPPPKFKLSKPKSTAGKSLGSKSVPRGLAKTKIAKPHRWLPGTVAFRQMKQQQRDPRFAIKRLPFQRCVREIGQDYMEDLRFTATAIDALQQGLESYGICRVRSAYSCALINGRETIIPIDFQNSKRIVKQFWGGDNLSDQVHVRPRKHKKRRARKSQPKETATE
jgi:histone H3